MEEKAQKISAWKIVLKQIKAFGAAAASGLILAWSLSQLYLDEYVDKKIETFHKELEEENSKKKPLRELLSETLQVPSEIVPYHIAGKFSELDSLISDLKKFKEDYLPAIDHQISITPLIRFINEHGEEMQKMPDGRDYRVNWTDGKAWIIYHGHRKDL